MQSKSIFSGIVNALPDIGISHTRNRDDKGSSVSETVRVSFVNDGQADRLDYTAYLHRFSIDKPGGETETRSEGLDLTFKYGPADGSLVEVATKSVRYVPNPGTLGDITGQNSKESSNYYISVPKSGQVGASTPDSEITMQTRRVVYDAFGLVRVTEPVEWKAQVKNGRVITDYHETPYKVRKNLDDDNGKFVDPDLSQIIWTDQLKSKVDAAQQKVDELIEKGEIVKPSDINLLPDSETANYPHQVPTEVLPPRFVWETELTALYK